jgi:hypothetical protein
MGDTYAKYGLLWNVCQDELAMEMDMIKRGGRWKNKYGKMVGLGMAYHFKRAISLLWPHIKSNRWFELIVDNYLAHRTIVVIGPASSGKTATAAVCVLLDYYCFPYETTVIVCSTTKQRLEDRIWGELKKLHKLAKTEYDWLPGNLIEGLQRLVTDDRKMAPEGRDFRNGIVGVPCLQGQTYAGLGSFAGLKNKRLRLLGDECFPAGTLVETPFGQRRIESIRPGDLVLSAAGFKPVSATSNRIAKSLVTIRTRDGRSVTCTPNHRFFTQFGWKMACEVDQGCYLLSAHEALQILRQNHPWNRQSSLLQGLRSTHAGVRFLRNSISSEAPLFDPEVLRAVLLHEIHALTNGDPTGASSQDKSGEAQVFERTSRVHGADGGEVPWVSVEQEGPETALRDDEGTWNKACDSRREWDGTNESGTSAVSAHSWIGLELRRQNRQVERQWISSGLQTGRGLTNSEIRSRGRRFCTQQSQPTGQRFEESRVFEGDWVDSVTVHQSGNTRFQVESSCDGGYRVYNLQVEGHPSYTVERFLVHNCSLLPRVFVDSLSNLDKNPDFKVVGLGNPKDTTDALGVLAEPAASVGGWDGGIDQAPRTKTWPTRRADGVCVQLVGSDSPNLDGKLGIPLITQEQIDRDVAFYGRESLWYTMMNQGMMPRGQGSRRVLTRQMCVKFGAFQPPIWQGTQRIKVAFLDAAYRGVGGDRCVFGTLEFGTEATSKEELPGQVLTNLINQEPEPGKLRQILALTSIEIVPINPQAAELAEDQIVKFVVKRCEDQTIVPANFFFDSGMRTSLVTAFGRLWSNAVNPIDCGGKPTERPVSSDMQISCRDYYSKYITELWYSVRLVVESSQFRGMTDEVVYEFGAREWTMVGANKIEVEPKDKMKLKMGRSPDLADAVAVGVEGARRLGFVIRKLVSPDFVKVDYAWKRELREKGEKLWRSHELNPAA